MENLKKLTAAFTPTLMFPLCTYKQMMPVVQLTLSLCTASHITFSHHQLLHMKYGNVYFTWFTLGFVVCAKSSHEHLGCYKNSGLRDRLQWQHRLHLKLTSSEAPKGWKRFFFFCLFFWTRWCFYKKCYLFMTALSAASHSVQRQRWSGRSHARVAGALSLTVFARVSGAAAGMHVTHTAFRVAPRCVSIANRNRTSSFD